MDRSNHHFKFKGIDLNQYSVIDSWMAIRKSGYEFVMLQLAQYSKTGIFEKDKRLDLFYKSAKNAKLRVGGYFNSKALTYDDLDFEINYIRELMFKKEFDLPIAIGFDDGFDFKRTGTKEELTDLIQYGLDALQEYKIPAMIKTDYEYFYSQLIPDQLKPYYRWLIKWSDNRIRRHDCDMLQYAYTSGVPGVRYSCGADMCYFNLNKINKT